MLEDGRAQKRKREDDHGGDGDNVAATARQPELEHGEYFFDDGNIVLIAQNTYYKQVFKGILAQDSQVFHDMFSLPQPPDAEQIDGCPVVHLQDSSKDLARILSVLFGNNITYFIPENSLPFVVVSTMLRLGSKYQIDRIRDEAIRRLKACFPENLADFQDGIVHDTADDDPYLLCKEVHLTAQHSIAVINLARTYNVLSLLGPAFYICAGLEFADWFKRLVDEDGAHWTLSTEDTQNCVRGECRLREANLHAVRWLFPPRTGSGCTTRKNCRAGITTSAKRLRQEVPTESGVLYESGWIDKLATGEEEDSTRPHGFCKACATHFKLIYEKERQDVWQNLGEYFNCAPLADGDGSSR